MKEKKKEKVPLFVAYTEGKKIIYTIPPDASLYEVYGVLMIATKEIEKELYKDWEDEK